MTMKNVLSKVGLDVHKEKVLLALITPHTVLPLSRASLIKQFHPWKKSYNDLTRGSFQRVRKYNHPYL